jgi:hypothetical protein
MSVGNSVFLKRSSLPSLNAWGDAIRKARFSVTLDSELNVQKSTGYRLGTYAGKEAGFEYSVEVIADRKTGLNDEQLRRIGDRDVEVIFTSGSRLRDLMAQTIASAVLASITDGIHWNHEADILAAGTEAIAHAQELEKDLRSDLEQEASAPPHPTPTTPLAVDVELKAKVVARGGTQLTIETFEQPIPRRFNLNLVTSELPEVDEVRILGLWRRPGLEPIVRRFALKPRGLFSRGIERSFDAFGNLRLEPSQVDFKKWGAKLGQVEAATQMLMAAGVAAVPVLIEAAHDASRPVSTRELAIKLLGHVGDQARVALPVLEELSRNPELADAAKSAIKHIGP